nr:TIGR02206 family membrane protein [Clostridium perfringens]
MSRYNTLNRLLAFSNEIFRIETDDYTFPLFSSLHFKIILCVIITIFIGIIFKEKIKTWKYRRVFEISIALILASTQIFLSIWYLRFPNFYLKESLPLYPCRIAIIMAAIGLIWKSNDFAKSIAYFWGTIGSIGALIIPITNSYIFPHITYYTFFIGHYFLLIASLYIILIEEFRVKRKNVKQALIFSFIFAICAFIANYLFNANYAFLNPPNGYEILNLINVENNIITTSIFAYFIFVLGIFIMYLPFNMSNYKKDSLFEYSLIKY